jgi:hypothetical protein
MTKKHINIGQSANDKDGDPLRTAFSKVNDNFDELYNHVSAGVVAGNTAPTDPGEGDLWWDSESGRIYVYYGSSWVDASPVDGTGISSTNELVNGGNTVSLGSDGKLTLPAGGDIINSSGQSVLGGGSTSYTPADTDNWNAPTVNTISAALDDLAARVTALQNFEIDGGNAYTPAVGELLIDGYGA